MPSWAPPGSHLGHVSGSAGAAGGGRGAHGSSDRVASVADHALHGSHADLRMMLLHVIAALVTALLLQHGESVLMRCACLALAVLAVLAHPPLLLVIALPVSERPIRPVPVAPHLLHAQRAVLTPQPRRGPPVVLTA